MAGVVIACLVLHNLLKIRYPTGQQDDWGERVKALILLEGNDIPHEAAKTQRNIFRDYFMNEGQVPWQMDKL